MALFKRRNYLGQKLIMNFDGLQGIADLEGASVIMAEPFQKGTDPRKLNINISDSTKQHTTMTYTTDLDTLKLIFQNMTFRSSSLANANLNDQMEKERVGVAEFAKNRFITCFCQSDHEIIPFWMYYGKKIRQNKVMLQFKNFANNIEGCLYMDFALVKDGKKCLFRGPEVKNIINGQFSSGSKAEEYDLMGIIDALLMFDVEYVSITDEVFSQNNAGESEVDFSKITGQKSAVVTMQSYDPTVLGKQKSNPWDYERETRILCSLGGLQSPGWDYIDLRLKPEIFRGLRIVLSPWDDGKLRDSIQAIIDSSALSQEIKESIVIVDSVLKGKLNFPEE